jgi:hypothetical protein
MKIRKDCSFVPEYPLLSTMTSPGGKVFQVRVINYSPKKWNQPKAQFGDPNIECSLTEESEFVDGQLRQILVVYVDRSRLTQLANEGRIDSGQVVLSIFATPTSSSTQQKVGECEVSVRIAKSTAIYPSVVNWSPQNPRDIRLIVTSRDKPLLKEDFRLSIGESPITAYLYEQLEGSWGKLTILSSALSEIKTPNAKIRISIPTRNFNQSILLRVTPE